MSDQMFNVEAYAEWRVEKQRIREQFGPLFGRVTDLLYRIDPVRINYGVNPDEYEAEVTTILPRLAPSLTEVEILEIVHEEFVRWFGPNIAGPRERYVPSAEAIRAAWQELVRNRGEELNAAQ